MSSREKVFLFEHATCSSQPMPAEIAVEGLGMFKTLKEGFESPISFYRSPDYIESFRKFLEKADYALAIAPESDMELYSLTRLIEGSGCENLGSSSKSVHIASDKLLTYKKIKDLSPKTELFRGKTNMDFPLVAKPRDGVSGEGIILVNNEEELERVPIDFLLQKYIMGRPMSASIIAGDEVKILSINTQEMNGFKYTGARLPISLSNTENIIEAVERVPGLFGYLGVDFILTENGPVVIEINSRPTTPIIGLKRAMDINVSDLILRNYKGKALPVVKQRQKIQISKIKSNYGFVSVDGCSIVIEDCHEDLNI